MKQHRRLMPQAVRRMMEAEKLQVEQREPAKLDGRRGALSCQTLQEHVATPAPSRPVWMRYERALMFPMRVGAKVEGGLKFLSEDSRRARLGLARISIAKGDIKGAKEQYQAILEVRPDDAEAKRGLAASAGRRK